ncbi:MAG: VCBS repeat-containing protein [Candidatus Thermoplasmatota archaeon]|nr:VCBS repeat-containing protein [Candidatus Thermoplasmatota archaeon]
MKLKLYITALCTCILFLSIYGSISATSNQTNIISDGMTIPDNNAEIYYELQGILNTNGYNNYYSNEQVLFDDYELGDIIWQYTLTIYDPSPKAIAPIPDVNNDGIDDVIVCSEDDYVRCFDGSAIGTGSILWEHNIYSGDVYNQNGLDIINDVDSDGYKDIVVGAAWGARLIRCISGDSGTEIWTHDTHEYGSGGWVYMVNSSYDYDSDGILDVLAATGDDSSDTGPKRVYCLDGETGISIWERPLGGPVFSVIGVEDFTGDGHPDVIAGCSNNAETIGYAKGINGDTGAEIWSFATPGSSVWALEQIDDITSDGIKDVIIGDFSGNIFGLDATNGNVEFSKSIGCSGC